MSEFQKIQDQSYELIRLVEEVIINRQVKGTKKLKQSLETLQNALIEVVYFNEITVDEIAEEILKKIS